jgi:hypothetical protein
MICSNANARVEHSGKNNLWQVRLIVIALIFSAAFLLVFAGGLPGFDKHTGSVYIQSGATAYAADALPQEKINKEIKVESYTGDPLGLCKITVSFTPPLDVKTNPKRPFMKFVNSGVKPLYPVMSANIR